MTDKEDRHNASGAYDPTAYTAIKRADRQLAGKRAKVAGEYFEHMIDTACELYEERGAAIVEKTPEPMRPLGAKNQKGQFIACYTKAAQPDYKGTIAGGRSIVMEAKHTDDDRIEYKRVTPEQMEKLEKHHRAGALAFVIVSFGLERFYRIPWTVWRDMPETFGRKYIKPEEVEQFRLPAPGGYIKFLDGIVSINEKALTYTLGDICVTCGTYVPEGMQVCPNCRKGAGLDD